MATYLPAYALWLIGGVSLFGLSLLVPKPSFAAMGLAGIFTGIFALFVYVLEFQIIFWVIIGVFLYLLFDRVFNQPTSMGLEPAAEGRVISRIPVNGLGRVSYEGTLWRARCQNPRVAIGPDQSVRVIGRQRNTLIVAPISQDKVATETNPFSDVNISDS